MGTDRLLFLGTDILGTERQGTDMVWGRIDLLPSSCAHRDFKLGSGCIMRTIVFGTHGIPIMPMAGYAVPVNNDMSVGTETKIFDIIYRYLH